MDNAVVLAIQLSLPGLCLKYDCEAGSIYPGCQPIKVKDISQELIHGEINRMQQFKYSDGQIVSLRFFLAGVLKQGLYFFKIIHHELLIKINIKK